MNTKLYCPHTVELLFDFFGEFGIKTNETYSIEKKKKVLSKIHQMLDEEILFVSKKKDNEFIRWNYPNEKIINRIDELWTETLNFSEFYNMIWFGYQEWYLEKLNILGVQYAKNWDEFINQKIGDLEKWINKNKPNKNTAYNNGYK
jgi:hypothetical protein